jgi:hypothetical protein
MKTEFKSELDIEILLRNIENGTAINAESAFLKIKDYINSLEDRIRHLETLEESKDTIIDVQKRLLEM